MYSLVLLLRLLCGWIEWEAKSLHWFNLATPMGVSAIATCRDSIINNHFDVFTCIVDQGGLWWDRGGSKEPPLVSP